jgi:hypothetical protein
MQMRNAKSLSGGARIDDLLGDLHRSKERQRRERLVKQKNEGDERRLLDELRAESMSKRMSHRGVRSDHQGVQGALSAL